MAIDREVNLKISALTDGGDKIRDLAKEVADLAAKGGDAAPAFQKLGKELDELANQQTLINQFTELKRQSAETATAIESATVATRASALALREKQTALDAAITAERAATAAVKEQRDAIAAAQLAITQSKVAIAGYKAETDLSAAATKANTAAIAAEKTVIAQNGAAIAAARVELTQLVPAQRAQAVSVKESSAALKEATTSFNVNKAAAGELKSAYTSANVALQTTRDKMHALGIAADDLVAAQQRVKTSVGEVATKVDGLSASAGKVSSGFGNLGAVASRAFAPVAALLASIAGFSEFVRVNVQLENINRTLVAVTGTSAAAAKEMEFIKDVSKRLGLELISTAQSYSKFSASTKGTVLEGEQTKKIFEAVSLAMATAGKSADETASALNALAQMVNKGTVSMEELRGQLGEYLPGALKIAADGLGLTTSELVKLVEKGEVLAIDLLPALEKQLTKVAASGEKSADTLSQSWNRFKNAITETGAELGKSGVLTGLLELGKLTGAVASGFGNIASIVGTGIGVAFGAATTSVGNMYDLLRTGDLEGFKAKTLALAVTLRESLSEEVDRATASIRKFSDDSKILQFILDKVGIGSAQTAVAVKGAGASAESASIGWANLTKIYNELVVEQEKAVLVSEKATVARKAEGDTMIAMATLFGTETEQRLAATAAAEGNQKALEEQVKQEQGLLTLLQSKLAAEIEYVKVNNDTSKERQDSIKTLTQKVAALQEETDKTIAQAQASKLAAEASRVEQEAHRDNSARLDELRKAYEGAGKSLDLWAEVNAKSKEKIAQLTQAQKEGKNVTEELGKAKERDIEITAAFKNAQLEAGKAATLFRDALKDQADYLKASTSAKQAEIGLQELGIRLRLQEVNGNIELAQAMGDQVEVRRLTIQKRELEVELMKLQMQLMQQEGQLALEIVKITREDLEARGELTRTKELELRKDELLAQSKIKQADITKVQIDGMERLNTAYHNGTTAVSGYGDATNKAADAGERLSRVPAPAGSGEGYGGGSSGGGSGTGGGGSGGKTESKMISQGYSVSAEEMRMQAYLDGKGPLGKEDMGYVASQLKAAEFNLRMVQGSTSGIYDAQGYNSAMIEYQKAKRAADSLGIVSGESAGLNDGKGGTGGFGGTGQGSGGFGKTTTGKSTTHNVNITIPGLAETSVGMVSEKDARNLTDLLSQLGSDKNRSN